MDITVDKEADEYLRELVKLADGEVGGMFYVDNSKPGKFHISEFVLLEQEASAAHVDIEPEIIAGEIARADSNDKLDLLKGSWHSHGDLGVYWSSTDEDAIKDYGKTGMDWLMSIVINKKGEMKTRFDQFNNPVFGKIFFEDCGPYEVVNSPMKDKAKKDFEELVVEDDLTAFGTGFYLNRKSKDQKDRSLSEDPLTEEEIEAIIEKSSDMDIDDDILEDCPTYFTFEDILDEDNKDYLVSEYGKVRYEKWYSEAEKVVEKLSEEEVAEILN